MWSLLADKDPIASTLAIAFPGQSLFKQTATKISFELPRHNLCRRPEQSGIRIILCTGPSREPFVFEYPHFFI
jgi:hypothetical protein